MTSLQLRARRVPDALIPCALLSNLFFTPEGLFALIYIFNNFLYSAAKYGLRTSDVDTPLPRLCFFLTLFPSP